MFLLLDENDHGVLAMLSGEVELCRGTVRGYKHKCVVFLLWTGPLMAAGPALPMRAGAQTLTALVMGQASLHAAVLYLSPRAQSIEKCYWFNVFVFSVVWLHASVVGQRLASCRFAVRRR